MGAVARAVMAVAVVVVPGALVGLMAFVVARTVMHSYRQVAAGRADGPVPVRQVLTSMRFSDLVREARAVAAL
jgi:hypothetical protein